MKRAGRIAKSVCRIAFCSAVLGGIVFDHAMSREIARGPGATASDAMRYFGPELVRVVRSIPAEIGAFFHA